jgi:hypothetical protein
MSRTSETSMGWFKNEAQTPWEHAYKRTPLPTRRLSLAPYLTASIIEYMTLT